VKRISNFFKGEAAKLKQMNFTEKRQYIWEYYKLHFGLTLLVLFIAYGFLDAWVLNPAKDELLNVAWLAENEIEEKFTTIQDALIPAIVTDPEKETCTVYSFAETGDPQFDMARGQQFQALLSSGQLDIFIVSGWDAVSEFAAIGYLNPVTDLMDELKAADPSSYEKIAPNITIGTFTTEDGESFTGEYGISLKDAQFINGLSFVSQDLYLCACVTSEKLPAMAKAVQVFFRE
jgi:hypothetical protein